MRLEVCQVLKGHHGRVWHCAWSPNGSFLATAGEDANIRLWGLQSDDVWTCQTVLAEGHTRTVRSVCWSPCGNYIASASFDATVAVWDRKSGQFECSASLEGHENEVKSVGWSVSGTYLASCSRDKSIWIWEVDEDEEFSCAAVLQSHSQDVKKVVWHPEQDVLVSCGYDNRIKMFKEDGDSDWTCFATLSSHDSTVWSIAFEKGGKRLASCSDDRTVKIWKESCLSTGRGNDGGDGDSGWKCVSTLSGCHTRSIYDVVWCHNTGLLATACGDNGIRIFREDKRTVEDDKDGPNFSLVSEVENAHGQDVNSVSWNPTRSGILASTSDDGTVKIWKVVEEQDDLCI